jgi:hypothetical protein
VNAQLETIAALMALRAAAFHVTELCDQALLGTDQDARVALRTLPRGIRVLHTRAQRALTALEAEEQG